MRQFAWYSPEFDVIVLQSIMEDCYITFEWDHLDLCWVIDVFGYGVDPMCTTTWLPLGEV